MNNFVFTILKNGRFVGDFSTSFEKDDINSEIFRIYNSENDSYQDIKITAELLKPKKIEIPKHIPNEVIQDLNRAICPANVKCIAHKVNELINYLQHINRGDSNE